MSEQNVGLVGWRGMVGSVLMQRMQEENDFDLIKPTFFTTSQKACLRQLTPVKTVVCWRMPLILKH